MVAVVQSRSHIGRRPARALAAGNRLPAPAVSESTYRRRRAAAAAAVVAVLVAVLVAVQGLLGVLGDAARPRPSPAPLAEEGVSTYVVQPGDTFWSIARRMSPGGDPRPLVDRLVAEHGSAVLHVGERVTLPERR
jgi:Tfp pilus assembly protein FimV